MWQIPIYDRTAANVAEGADKCYMNAETLNRIEGNTAYMASLLGAKVSTRHWEATDFLTRSEMERILQNIQAVRDAYFVLPGTSDLPETPTTLYTGIGYRGYGTGKLMKDEQFDANLAGAKAHDKLLGFYFFSQAITEDEARAEADFCASVAPTGYPLFFDAEWSRSVHDGRADSLTKAQRTACAQAFCKRAVALGYQPGVYTFTAFATANIDYEGLCKDYIGWLADTRASYDKTLPRHIHQFGQTAKGGVPGIGPETDLNRIVKALPTLDKPAEPTHQEIWLDHVVLPNAAAMEFYSVAKKYGLDNDKAYHAKFVEG